MWKKCLSLYGFLNTDSKDYSLLILRLSLWIFMFFHWAQKLFWIFGWPWYEWAMWFLVGMWIPSVIAFLVIIWEALWWLALIVWFKVRFMAFASILILLWAVFIVHIWEWFLGYEKHILAIAISIAIMIKWAWAFSLDTVMKKMFK
jgi:uncharacterized membrane protein YphA (DoxX/SURF4 family)